MVYFGSNDNNLYVLKATDGKLYWKLGNGGDVISSPAIANCIIYVGSYDRRVYALDAITGTQAWNYTANSNFPNPRRY